MAEELQKNIQNFNFCELGLSLYESAYWEKFQASGAFVS